MWPRNAVLAGGDARGLRHWDLRCSSYGATKRVRGVPNWVAGTHVSAATGVFGGAPYGATKRVRGVPRWVGGGDACERRHWGLRWSFPWGHETCAGCAGMGGGEACEPCHWRLRWSSLWGHETCEGCAEMGAVGACERNHLGLRWRSLWGHETCEGCTGLGVGDACGRWHWGRRWSSLWGHETLHWAQETHASSAGDDPFATGAEAMRPKLEHN